MASDAYSSKEECRTEAVGLTLVCSSQTPDVCTDCFDSGRTWRILHNVVPQLKVP